MRRAGTVIATLAIPVVVVLALAFGLAFGLTACGEDAPPAAAVTETVTVTATPSVTASPTEGPSATMTVSLYFLRGETLGVAHRTVPKSDGPATAAMNALLGGPDMREKAAGLGTTIPEGTTLNGVTIEDGTAQVDLGEEFASRGGTLSMQARLAEVVYTLTQFRGVKRVEFLLDGEPAEALGGEGIVLDEPQRRADWEDLLPAVFIESPAVGDVITTQKLRVSGTASVFEATFVAQIVNPTGQIVVDQTVTAKEGAPGRGAFLARLDLPVATGKGKLVVYEVSMEDGSRMNEVRIPLRFAIEE
jgi:hypothetical protein